MVYSEYVRLDPETGYETEITDFGEEAIAALAESGAIVFGVEPGGERHRVEAADVKAPTPMVRSQAVAPLDKCIKALKAVYALVNPEAATADETGEETTSSDPVADLKAVIDELDRLAGTDSKTQTGETA